MSDRMTHALQEACQMFLYPIAKFLLANGMKFNPFVEAARLAFVQAAQDQHESVSKIATLTGIPRKEVARLKDLPRVNVNKMAKEIAQSASVFSYWVREAEYLTREGIPKELTRREFYDLVAQVHKDSSDAAEILRDLIATESIEPTSRGTFRAKRRYYIPPKDDTRRITRYGIRLRDLASTLHRNSGDSENRVVEAAAYNCYLSLKSLPVLQLHARQHGNALLSEFDDWLTEQHRRGGGNGEARAGVGIYFFEEENSA